MMLKKENRPTEAGRLSVGGALLYRIFSSVR
jgi:hypothetical protein